MIRDCHFCHGAIRFDDVHYSLGGSAGASVLSCADCRFGEEAKAFEEADRFRYEELVNDPTAAMRRTEEEREARAPEVLDTGEATEEAPAAHPPAGKPKRQGRG